jgi:hypothetical protein
MGDVSGLPVVTKQGESVNVFQGQLFDSSHPVVKAFPKMFGQPDNATRTVEQATAAPGEKRNLQAAS